MRGPPSAVKPQSSQKGPRIDVLLDKACLSADSKLCSNPSISMPTLESWPLFTGCRTLPRRFESQALAFSKSLCSKGCETSPVFFVSMVRKIVRSSSFSLAMAWQCEMTGGRGLEAAAGMMGGQCSLAWCKLGEACCDPGGKKYCRTQN